MLTLKKITFTLLLSSLPLSLYAMQKSIKEELRAEIQKYSQDPSNPTDAGRITLAIYKAGDSLTLTDRTELLGMLIEAKKTAFPTIITRSTPILQLVTQKPPVPVSPQTPVASPVPAQKPPLAPVRIIPPVQSTTAATNSTQQQSIPPAAPQKSVTPPSQPATQDTPPAPAKSQASQTPATGLTPTQQPAPVISFPPHTAAFYKLHEIVASEQPSKKDIQERIAALEKAINDAGGIANLVQPLKNQIELLLPIAKQMIETQSEKELIDAIKKSLKALENMLPIMTTIAATDSYNKIKEKINRLQDKNEREEHLSSLENIWEKRIAEQEIRALIRTLKEWDDLIYQDIRKNISANNFDTNKTNDLLKLSEAAYNEAKKRKTAPTVPPQIQQPSPVIPKALCERVKAINAFSDEETVNKLMNDLKSTAITLPSIKSIGAAHQSGAQGGGGASCGYHALKNGIYIARAILGLNNWDETEKSAIVMSLFGTPQSPWRKTTSENREYEVLQNYIFQQLKNNYLRAEQNIVERTPWVRTQDTFKIRDLYSTMLKAYAQTLAKNIIASNSPMSVNDQEIINLITAETDSRMRSDAIKNDLESYAQGKDSKRIPGNTADQKTQAVAAYLKNRETIEKYMNLSPAPRTFSRADIPTAMQAYVDSGKGGIASAGSTGIASGGDWLNNLEIEKLVGQEAQRGGLLDPNNFRIPVEITAVNNISNIDSAIFFILKEIAEKYATQKEYIHIFCLQIPGHWFSLVLHKNQAQKTTYFVADSGGNPDLKHLTIEPLIHILESLKICFS